MGGAKGPEVRWGGAKDCWRQVTGWSQRSMGEGGRDGGVIVVYMYSLYFIHFMTFFRFCGCAMPQEEMCGHVLVCVGRGIRGIT